MVVLPAPEGAEKMISFWLISNCKMIAILVRKLFVAKTVLTFVCKCLHTKLRKNNRFIICFILWYEKYNRN